MASDGKQQDRKSIFLVIAIIVALVVFWRVGALDRYIQFFQGAPSSGNSSPNSSAESPNTGLSNTEGGSVFSQLSASDREKYLIVLDVFKSRSEHSYPSADIDDLSRIRDFVLADHPELFYVSNVQLRTSSIQGTGLAASSKIEGQYAYSVDDANQLRSELESLAMNLQSELPSGADDYTKAKFLFEYIVNHVEYDSAAAHDGNSRAGQTAVDALIGGKAVCAGYAHAYQYLMRSFGIPCMYIVGESRGGGHAWCAALIEGSWYHIDPTWGDPQFLLDDGNMGDSGFVSYDYLCVTDSDIAKTHKSKADFPVPPCSSTADNYYIKEGLYLNDADLIKANSIIEGAAERGEAVACFRCANDTVYNQVVAGLFGDSGIYSLAARRSFRYAVDANMHTIKVLL